MKLTGQTLLMACLMHSMLVPRRSHHTESFESPYRALGLEDGTPLSVRIVFGSPKSLKALSKNWKGTGSSGGREGVTIDEVAAGVVGDRQKCRLEVVAGRLQADSREVHPVGAALGHCCLWRHSCKRRARFISLTSGFYCAVKLLLFLAYMLYVRIQPRMPTARQ